MGKVWLATALLVAPAFMSPAPAQESRETTAEAPKEKLICRVDRATGSRVRVNRVCLTREQWAEVAEKRRQTMTELGRSGAISPCGPAGPPGAGGCNPAPGPGSANPF